MAVYQAVDAQKLDQDLQNVADAIRAKGKTSQSMAFPNGFLSAVAALPDEANIETATVTPASYTTTLTFPVSKKYDSAIVLCITEPVLSNDGYKFFSEGVINGDSVSVLHLRLSTQSGGISPALGTALISFENTSVTVTSSINFHTATYRLFAWNEVQQ